jgi:hypothetical protein
MSNLADTFGTNCQVFEDNENLASVGTNLFFWDDDPLYLFVEQVESRIRIFDDGEVVMHMFGSGIHYRNENFMESVVRIAALEGVSLNAEDELEIWAESSGIADAYARYMSVMDALLKWESAEVNRMATPRVGLIVNS